MTDEQKKMKAMQEVSVFSAAYQKLFGEVLPAESKKGEPVAQEKKEEIK